MPEQNTWKFYPLPVQDGARTSLRKTDRSAAIAGLEKLVQTVESPFVCWQAAHSLGKVFDPGNEIAIAALIRATGLVSHSDLLIKICESLTKIDPNYNETAIATLVDIIHSKKTVALTRKAAFTLGKVLLESAAILMLRGYANDNHNSLLILAIDTLVRIIESGNSSPAPSPRHHADGMAAIENLRQIAPTHPATQQQFIDARTLPSSTHNRRKKVARTQNIEIAIAKIEQKLITINNVESQRRYAYQLGKFQPGHPLAVDFLLKLLSTPQSKSFYKLTAEYLKEIALIEQLPLIVDRLKSQVIAVAAGDRSACAMACYKLLWYCAEQIPDRQFTQIWDR
ncbi:hypothetical protein [Chamaesiphon polymorphus]|uniref:HEAT repeat domain-containing protein n=1 Tax=Chamaesiphon polymorphus CCALA 037 TaxID=2107692 RepID=A0A2T1GJE4_9CYAN|nr:hypothetical protein [Chamaesiphon polymorphus]PSB57908.1 hypothetical protein C7B77_06715 [Chamaesiphon polymorphus CCALA 037]